MCVALLHMNGCLNVISNLHLCLCLKTFVCCDIVCVLLFECNVVFEVVIEFR